MSASARAQLLTFLAFNGLPQDLIDPTGARLEAALDEAVTAKLTELRAKVERMNGSIVHQPYGVSIARHAVLRLIDEALP